MPPLKNPGHERACQEFVKAPHSQRAALVAAGYKDTKATKQTAAEIFNRPEVQERLQELFAEVRENAQVDAQRIVAEIDKMALSDVGHLFDLDADELRLLPMKDWPPEARAAVAGVDVKRYPLKDGGDPPITVEDLDYWENVVMGRGLPFDISRALPSDVQAKMLGIIKRLRAMDWGAYEIIKLKFWDKNKAAENAGKHRGVFSDDNTGAPQGVNINNVVEITRVMTHEEWLASYGPKHLRRPDGESQLARLAGATEVRGEEVPAVRGNDDRQKRLPATG